MKVQEYNRVARILFAAGMGLMPGSGAKDQIIALMREAGFDGTQLGRLDIASTKHGTRYRVHLGGWAPQSEKDIAAFANLTADNISNVMSRAGITNAVVTHVQAGTIDDRHCMCFAHLGGPSRPIAADGFFVEFHS